MSLNVDTAPAWLPLVLEVASESTWWDDVGDKRGLYALIGVQEYLIFDPTGEFLGEQVRGWHRVDGAWQPWQPARCIILTGITRSRACRGSATDRLERHGYGRSPRSERRERPCAGRRDDGGTIPL